MAHSAAAEPPGQPDNRLEELRQSITEVGHEYNNLLGVVLIYQEILRRRTADLRDLADLNAIRMAAERAVVLTQQMMSFPEAAPTYPDDSHMVER